MPQFGASLADDSRVIIYDRNMFIVQATDHLNQKMQQDPNFTKPFWLKTISF
jgi:hypothetical protein